MLYNDGDTKQISKQSLYYKCDCPASIITTKTSMIFCSVPDEAGADLLFLWPPVSLKSLL